MINHKCYLVKFLDKEWAVRLLEGEVYFRSIENYSNTTKWSIDKIKNFSPDRMGGINYSDGTGSGLIDVLTLREKIYCMSMLEYDDIECRFIKPDNKMRIFGDTAVIIYDPKEFLHRICCSMLSRFGNDFWTSFQQVTYDVNLFSEQPYDIFSKHHSYGYQKEFRIALDLADGKFNPEILKDITDFARLTFPGKIVEDCNPDSLSDTLTLNIGSIRDISIEVASSALLGGEFEFLQGLTPPTTIEPLIIPRKPKPTFFKIIHNLP